LAVPDYKRQTRRNEFSLNFGEVISLPEHDLQPN